MYASATSQHFPSASHPMYVRRAELLDRREHLSPAHPSDPSVPATVSPSHHHQPPPHLHQIIIMMRVTSAVTFAVNLQIHNTASVKTAVSPRALPPEDHSSLFSTKRFLLASSLASLLLPGSSSTHTNTHTYTPAGASTAQSSSSLVCPPEHA